jgi:hypothetical protein
MDSTHLHLLLDIREGQHQHTALLQNLAERQEEALRLLKGIGKLLRERPSSRPSKASSALAILTSGTFAQYATTAMLLVYVLKGGDVLTAIATVSKVFGGP